MAAECLQTWQWMVSGIEVLLAGIGLNILLFSDEMDASLTSEKVIESLLGAMERYTKNVEIQEHALYTLGRLILESGQFCGGVFVCKC